MQQLTVKKLCGSVSQCAPENIPSILDNAGIGYEKIACDNWNWAKCNPDVQFRIAHDGANIVLQFVVDDHEIRGVEVGNDSRVWEDSCCEFFVSPDCNDLYYNFECNCVGSLLLHGGVKPERPSAPEEVYDSVRRWSSLGSAPIEREDRRCRWTLVEIIPATALFLHNISTLDGLEMTANFYKCGDLLSDPHFLSWSPITLEKPMFHCPEFFSRLIFE